MTESILVTGGAGYIGSHTCKVLSRDGFTPITYDNLSSGHRSAVRWGPFEEGDVTDYDRLTQVMQQYQPSAVIHFAADAYVEESIRLPQKYYRNNVGGALCLLAAMRAQGVSRIVLSSTCAVYGVPGEMPITESSTRSPISPYGRSKLMVEQMFEDSVGSFPLEVCCLRYFNAAGADPDGDIGELHDPETHAIPNMLKAAAGEIPEFVIHGDDYDTADGTCIRDYVHVMDLAEAHCLALKYLHHQTGFHVFNLGSGRGYSVMELLRQAEKTVGREIPMRLGPRREGDPPMLIAEANRATISLGWERRLTSAQAILSTAWDWHQSVASGR